MYPIIQPPEIFDPNSSLGTRGIKPKHESESGTYFGIKPIKNTLILFFISPNPNLNLTQIYIWPMHEYKNFIVGSCLQVHPIPHSFNSLTHLTFSSPPPPSPTRDSMVYFRFFWYFELFICNAKVLKFLLWLCKFIVHGFFLLATISTPHRRFKGVLSLGILLYYSSFSTQGI